MKIKFVVVAVAVGIASLSLSCACNKTDTTEPVDNTPVVTPTPSDNTQEVPVVEMIDTGLGYSVPKSLVDQTKTAVEKRRPCTEREALDFVSSLCEQSIAKVMASKNVTRAEAITICEAAGWYGYTGGN
jgi:hypothetical protein